MNIKKFRLLYLTPIIIGVITFTLMTKLSWNIGKITGDDNLDVVFFSAILNLMSVSAFTLIPLGLFRGVIDIKKNKDFILFLIILIALIPFTWTPASGLPASTTPLAAILFFVVMSLMAVKLKDKGEEKFKWIFPMFTILAFIIYVPGGPIIKIGIKGTSYSLLAYAFAAAITLGFSIPLLKNK